MYQTDLVTPPAANAALTAVAAFPAELISVLCLLAFTTIAGVDGLYFHLYRYRLHERAASRTEHLLHTLNVILFVPLTALLYCVEPLGLWRWLVLALFGLSVGIEILDVRCEEASRRELGGLTNNEYLMHFLMSGLRGGAVLPILTAGSAAQWSLAATELARRPLWLILTGAWIAGPGILIAALHVHLWFRGGRTLRARAQLAGPAPRRHAA